MKELLKNLDKLNSTALGIERVRKNLSLQESDVVAWCKKSILNAESIFLKGKNWYIGFEDCIITVNKYSYTIITAHKRRI